MPYNKNMRISSSLYGIQNAYKKINKSAENIANSKLENLPEDMVNLMEGQREVEANLKVIKTNDELLGTIIDTFA